MRSVFDLRLLSIFFLTVLITGCAQRKLEVEINTDPSSSLDKDSEILLDNKLNENNPKTQEDSDSKQKYLGLEDQAEEGNVEKIINNASISPLTKSPEASLGQGKSSQPIQPTPGKSPIPEEIPIPNVNLSTFPLPPIEDLPPPPPIEDLPPPPPMENFPPPPPMEDFPPPLL